MLDKCNHDTNPNCVHWRWDESKNDKCIHDEDASCFHCNFNKPYLMKGIDPEPPKEQTTTDYKDSMLWVENGEILRMLSSAKFKLRLAMEGGPDYHEDCDFMYGDECSCEPFVPNPIEVEAAQKEVEAIIDYVKEAQRLKEMEWNYGRFK